MVKVNFSGDAPSPASFSTRIPPRIAFDFPNVINQSDKSSVQVNGNVLRQVNVAEGNGRTRLVLSMQKQASYDVKTEGKSAIITLDGSTVAAAAPKVVQFAEAVGPVQAQGPVPVLPSCHRQSGQQPAERQRE